MPRGSRTSYSSKQHRQARDIEDGYAKPGRRRKETSRRVWAPVKKDTGGKKSSRGKRTSRTSAR
jgi:hypothetical protein